MGWSDCGTDEDGRPIGYAHEAKCDHPGCDNDIDRGLAYACGGMHGHNSWFSCDKYFCGEHLMMADTDPGEMLNLCPSCHRKAEAFHDSCQMCDFLDAFECGGNVLGQCTKIDPRREIDELDGVNDGREDWDVFCPRPDWCPLKTDDDDEIRSWIADTMDGYSGGEKDIAIKRVFARLRRYPADIEAILDRLHLESMTVEMIVTFGMAVNSNTEKGDSVREAFCERVLRHFDENCLVEDPMTLGIFGRSPEEE